MCLSYPQLEYFSPCSLFPQLSSDGRRTKTSQFCFLLFSFSNCLLVIIFFVHFHEIYVLMAIIKHVPRKSLSICFKKYKAKSLFPYRKDLRKRNVQLT